MDILDGGCELGGHVRRGHVLDCLCQADLPTDCLSQRPRPRHRFSRRCSTAEISSGNRYFNSTPITHLAPPTPEPMPTIASSAPPPQRLPPGDTDLQELYDQVLSAFAEESSPSNFSPTFSISRSNNVDPDSLYSPHSDEGVASQVSSRPPPQSRRQSLPLLPFPLLLSLSLFQPPQALATTTAPFTLQQRFQLPPSWARALAPYQSSLLPHQAVPHLTPPTCLSRPSFTILSLPPLQAPSLSSAWLFNKLSDSHAIPL